MNRYSGASPPSPFLFPIQKKLASLVGVSAGAIVGWESGKFKPRGNKVGELSDLEKWEKSDVGNVLGGKEKKESQPDEKKERKTERSGVVKRAKATIKRRNGERRRGKSPIWEEVWI